MPEWVAVAEGPVRRGERVHVDWAAGAGAGHELRLALVVHHGAGAAERRAWVVHDRAAVSPAGGTAQLHVPPGAPYSYPGTVLAFLWGVALADPARPGDRPAGWSAVQVLP
jgi:hypothetical protein